MRTKSQAFDIFQKFICQEERQSENRLKHLRSNFEGKFANKAFEEYTAKESVKEEPNTPYTQEQNRKEQRFNYILMSFIRCILAAIHLPKTL